MLPRRRGRHCGHPNLPAAGAGAPKNAGMPLCLDPRRDLATPPRSSTGGRLHSPGRATLEARGPRHRHGCQTRFSAGLRLCWHGAFVFLATKSSHSAVQSSCWYLDWPSQWTDFYEYAADEGPLQNQSNRRLLGGEAALWTERMDFTNVLCRAWPRGFAVAERLWSDTKPGAIASEQRDPQVDRRLELQSERFQRLHRLNLRPLRPGGTAPLEVLQSDLKNVDRTCPLLESQAIQRDEPPGKVPVDEESVTPGTETPKRRNVSSRRRSGSSVGWGARVLRVLMGLLRHVGPPGVNAKQTLSNVNKDLRQSGGTPGDPRLESWRRDPELCLIWAAFCTSSPLSLADGIALAKTRRQILADGADGIREWLAFRIFGFPWMSFRSRSAQEALQLLTGKGTAAPGNTSYGDATDAADDAKAHVGDADGTAPGLMDAADAPDFIRAGPAAYGYDADGGA
ncbi:unnamed protein product [Cladocopium goreaui]|uniref:beta-N-acetylhexosaminidase n=1 Tax=Cladocopium goreaui TaxID=2562237 RepID=A0A9P1FIX4_9DINO|nr:unnamed protein product [Cladocopium goreaui]